ncbi:2'-5' RNA ligase family protein [Rhizobium sp.]|uniref:2'-5' RNA ligase family protein n=1 Tax=Rhizobium sp. TaxID=391 RepID=UPI00289D26C5
MQYHQPSLPLTGNAPEKNRSGHPHFAPRRRSELFFVLKPPPSLAEEIYKAACEHAHGRTNRQPHPAHLLHVSLLSMDEFDEPPYELIPRIETAIGSIRACPLTVTLDGCAIYGGGRHLALTSAAKNTDIQAFARMLHGALSRHNLPRQAFRAPSPHVTIIYGYGCKEVLNIGKLSTWQAREFALVYSHKGETRHEPFGCWRFNVDAPPYSRPASQLSLLDEPITGGDRNPALTTKAAIRNDGPRETR